MATQSNQTAELICALRKGIGWSQRELAERSGMDRNIIVNIEVRRRSTITLDEFVRIAAAFGVSPMLLLGEPTAADRARLGERVMEELAAVLND